MPFWSTLYHREVVRGSNPLSRANSSKNARLLLMNVNNILKNYNIIILIYLASFLAQLTLDLNKTEGPKNQVNYFFLI